MNNEPDKNTFSPADKATALSALAFAKETKPKQCPSPGELACLVDGKSDENEKQKLLSHLANCRKCYNQWLMMSQISKERPQNKIISGPWGKIIKIGSPILAVAASVAIFLNVFGPASPVITPLEEETSPLTSSYGEKIADMGMMDDLKQEAVPKSQKTMAKAAKKERVQRKSFSAEQKAPIAATRSLPGVAAPAPRHSQTFVFSCNDDFEFVARIEGNNAWLFLPGNTVKAPHVPSASGSKYANGSIVFWSKGEESLLEIADSSRYECRNNRSKAIWEQAKLDGVSFRAVGNEPGWELTITHGENLIFITDYGQEQYSWPTPDPIADQQKKQTTYTAHSDGDTIEVLLQIGPCQDSMADISYETQVTVTLNGKKYRGCGRALH